MRNRSRRARLSAIGPAPFRLRHWPHSTPRGCCRSRWPSEHGGAGLTVVTLTEVIRVIATVDPAIAQAPQGHFLMVDVLTAHANAAQRERLFAEILDGGRIGSALAERGNKHAQDLKTRLLATDLGPRLEGRKYYCTGGLTSRWLGVTALDPTDRLALAFVERDAPGVTMDEEWNVMGQRATSAVERRLRTLLSIHNSSLITKPCSRPRSSSAPVLSCSMPRSRSGSLAGRLRTLPDSCVPAHAHHLRQYERAGPRAPARTRTRSFVTGRWRTRVRAAETLLADAAAVQAEVGLVPASAAEAAHASIAVAQAKAFASEVAVEVASDLFALTGASAADERYDFSRHWRNARTHASHDPADWKYHHTGNFLLNGVAAAQPPADLGRLSAVAVQRDGDGRRPQERPSATAISRSRLRSRISSRSLAAYSKRRSSAAASISSSSSIS